jgi:alpha-beta hydrolase superfamily lysophospholipase
MIKNPAVLSTSHPGSPTRRALLAAGAASVLAGCVSVSARQGAPQPPPAVQDGAFVMPDGARLPFRCWLPAGAPHSVVLALHGFNDSRDAWEVPAPTLTEAGFAIYGPDQLGFGSAPSRGLWAGTATMVADAAEMARQVALRHPGARLVLLGESMGGAVLMCLATGKLAPPGARYVLVAPAVWGRASMNLFLRASLWIGTALMPGMTLTGAPIRVTASDNRDAIIRLSRDPLTIHATRVSTLHGLVDLMDAAFAAARVFAAEGLFLYGGLDELVPKGAMATMWRELPPGGARAAYYPGGYHLILRDRERAVALADIVAWVRDPRAPLPSGADRAAASWLAAQA